MKTFNLFVAFLLSIILTSCATSKSIVSYNADNISKYRYVVFGNERNGDRGLDDVIMSVENEISMTNLQAVSSQDGFSKIANGEYVLSPHIHVTTEKWDGGHTYITITFYDYNTDQCIIILKSSGIGLSISQDQNIAIKAIRKELRKVFGGQ